MKLTIGFCAALLSLAAMPAGAACTQADLKGTWGLSLQTHADSALTGTICHVIVQAAGAIAHTSNCVDTGGKTTTLTGTLTLGNVAACDYSGSIRFVATNDVNEVPHTTLSPDHDVVSGIGYDRGAKVGYAFTMVRIQ